MNKQALIKELQENSYIMLKPSAIEGVGVFAVRNIPRGCRDMFSAPHPSDRWITLTKEEVAVLPDYSRLLVENYCLYDNAVYFVPANGFKKIDLALFINHSDEPNIISINDGDYFEAVKDIEAGEELLLDYGQLVQDH